METETQTQTIPASEGAKHENDTNINHPQSTSSNVDTAIEDKTNDEIADETTANQIDTQNEEKEEKEGITSSSNPTAASTASPLVANPMNNLNPMMMPPMMPAMNGMNPMNPPPMMPGFAPYPMFGAPTMLPFMPGLNPSAIASANNANKTKTGKRCGDWQSYITEKGKTYYFNVATKVNTWDQPKEWIDDDAQPQSNAQETKAQSADAIQPTTSTSSSVTPSDSSHATQETSNKSKKDGYLGTAATKQLAVIKDNVAKRSFGTVHKTKYKDRTERVKAFRALLKDKQIEADWNWKKVLPKIVTDKRYNALMKLDDKKNELILWQQDEKKRIQDEEREKRHQLKSGYFELLDEFIDKIIRKEYRKAKHYLESDDRFVEIASKHRREEWFDEWQSVRYKEYKKERKKKKEMAMKEFAERLKSCDLLKIDSEWTDIRTKLSFLSEPFMEPLSDRNQEKIFDEILDELIEKDKEEKRRKVKQNKKQFGELMDELIGKKMIHTRCRYDDQDIVQLMANDERYKEMSQHVHDLKSIFNQKMDELKDKLKDDKKIFKQFMRTKELAVGIQDTWSDILPQFKKLSENHSVSGKINENHLEHLLAEYVFKKQKELKIHSNKKPTGKELNAVVVNSKKRDRNDMEHEEDEDEPQKKRQKTDKKYVDVTIHDPASYKQKKEETMDEGEIEELEEGELSDVDIVDNNVKYKTNNRNAADEDEKMDHNHHRNGHCADRKRSDSLSSKYSASLSPPRSVKSNRSRSKSSDLSSNGALRSRSRSRNNSRSRSRSSNYSFDSNDSHRKSSKKRHKKSGKRHKNHRKYDRNHRHHHREDKKRREHKKHNRDHKENKKKHRERKRERERQREKESPRVKYSNIDNILYGITSDIDEGDLYYRGDIKRSDQISHDHDDDIHHEDLNGITRNVHNNNENINNHKRNQRRGGLSHWNNNPRRHHHHHHHYKPHYKHHDLDYNNSYTLNDHEINADSYNLDNDEMARWNQ